MRGYWWSPDGERLAVCRVDDAEVPEWTIADPAQPDQPARVVRYPAAGTANPHVTVHVVDLDGGRVDVEWDVDFFPYVTDVSWSDAGLLMHVQSRDQRGTMSLLVDPDTGATAVLGHDYDDAWIELVPGSPQLLPDARLVTCADRDGVRRILVEGEPVTPTTIQVRSIGRVDSDRIRFLGNLLDTPEEMHVFEVLLSTESTEVCQLTDRPGVHAWIDAGPGHSPGTGGDGDPRPPRPPRSRPRWLRSRRSVGWRRRIVPASPPRWSARSPVRPNRRRSPRWPRPQW